MRGCKAATFERDISLPLSPNDVLAMHGRKGTYREENDREEKNRKSFLSSIQHRASSKEISLDGHFYLPAEPTSSF